MGSVLSICECPRCGAAAFSDYYYRSGEEYVYCEWCGFCRELTWQDGTLVPKDTIGYASIQFRQRGQKRFVQAIMETADDLSRFIAGTTDLEYVLYRRYLDGKWIEVNALTGEEKSITAPCKEDVEAGRASCMLCSCDEDAQQMASQTGTLQNQTPPCIETKGEEQYPECAVVIMPEATSKTVERECEKEEVASNESLHY
jgi:hypothetical protein